MRWAPVLAVAATLVAGVAAAEDLPPQEPMLRIEAGMHVSHSAGFSASTDGSLLATGGDDNTIRLWALPEGRLLKTIRLPSSTYGKVQAVALAPDKSWVAAGGFDAHSKLDSNHFVYVFDVETGEMTGRLGPGADATLSMAVSRDGSRLAVGLGGTAGLQIFDMPSGELLAEDSRYEVDVYAVAYAPAGNLVAISRDGRMTLYDRDGERLEQGNAGGAMPFFASFAPDGERFAVGYYEDSAINIFSTESLERVDRRDMDDSNVMRLDWTDDNRLFAGGRSQGATRILAWDMAGDDPASEYPVAVDDIRALEHVAPHGLAFMSFDPALGLLGEDGEARMLREAVVMPFFFDLIDRAIGVSADAARVIFSIKPAGGEPLLFDLAELTLQSPTTIPNDLHGPDMQGVPPQIAEQDFSVNEGALAATMLGDGGFVVGTNFNLRRFDRRGNEVWHKVASGDVGAVNTSADRELIVATYADGTIRWHRTSDGEQLLSLFLHLPDRRWILWTPRGYYAASPGGEELVGWHVNRGWAQAADFFPAAQFRDRFYRPDVVQRVLATRDVELALAEANEEANRRQEDDDVSKLLPPVIEIVGLSDDATVSGTTLTVSYRLRSPSGLDVVSVEALIDGRPPATRGLERVDAKLSEATECESERGLARVSTCADGSLTLAIPQRDFELSLIARTGGAASLPARVTLEWQGEVAAEASDAKPKLFAVLVGVSQYQNPDYSLGFPAQDAKDMDAALREQANRLYGEVETRLLTDLDATVPNILDALSWLEEQVSENDVGLLFLAGHGVTDARQRFYYLPHEVDPERLRSTAVSDSDIQETIGALAGKALFFIDACHSGDAFRETADETEGAADITSIINEFSAAENGIVMFASSTGREVSIERQEWANGAFTEALLEGLAGGADFTGDGHLTVAEMDLWLSERVKSLTEQQQHAVVRRPDTVPDFAIAAVD